MFNVPKEINLSIFSFLNKQDLASIMRVNKKGKMLGEDNTLWDELLRRDFNCKNISDMDSMTYYKILNNEKQKLFQFLLADKLIWVYRSHILGDEVKCQLFYRLFVNLESPDNIIADILQDELVSDQSVTDAKNFVTKLIEYLLLLDQATLASAIQLIKLEPGYIPYIYPKNDISKCDAYFEDYIICNLLNGLFLTSAKNLLNHLLIRKPLVSIYGGERENILHIAIMSAQPELVEMILARGAKDIINKRTSNSECEYPLAFALLLMLDTSPYTANLEEIIKLLIKAGADPTIHDPELGKTIVDFCKTEYKNQSKPDIKSILEFVINSANQEALETDSSVKRARFI